MEHYDVIIIGTGAGGGTLAHRLAPTGKRILLLERGGYLPREPENWDSQEVFGKERYLSGEEWIDKDGDAFRPHQQYFVGGNTKFYGAILFRLRERDFGEVRHYGGDLAGVAAVLRRPRALLRRGRAPVPRPRRARRGPDRGRRPRAPSPTPPSRTSRASSSSHDDFVRAGHHPFHLPVGVDLDETDPEAGRCVRCDRFDGFPCLTDGKADAHVRCVRPRGQAGERHAAHPRARPAAGDRRQRAHRHRGRRRSARRRGALQRRRGRRLVRCGQLGGAAAALGQRAPPARPGQLARTWWAATTWPTSTRASSRSRRPPTRRSSRRPSASTTTTGDADDFDFPLGHIQMLGKSDRHILRAGAPWFAPGLALDYMARHAIDFWLTTEDLPHPDNRVTVDRAGPDPPGQDRPQQRAPPPAAGQAQGPARPAGLPRDVHPRLVGPRPAHPAGRGRPPVRDRALRRGPGDVGPRRALQGPRPRQPLRRRHELLPVVQRREPGADGDGERAARRRPPDRAASTRPSRPELQEVAS